MTRQTYILDTRHRAGLSISTLNRRRPAHGNARAAQALAALVALAVSALAIYTTITANQ
jgi:hypothetical protein